MFNNNSSKVIFNTECISLLSEYSINIVFVSSVRIILLIMSLILIDTSYTSFYRFFATIRWYSLSNPEEFKEKNNYELPLGIIIGKVCKKYLKAIELV